MTKLFKKTVLKNGIRLIVSPMKGTRIVSINIFIGCGSRWEKESNNGITHFIEHMLFKGTERRRDAFSISKEADEISGDLNAATGQECCYFYMRILDRHLRKALDILSDILLNSRFDEGDMEVERKTILEEIKMRKDTPAAFVWEVYNSLLYGSQPLGFTISGREEVLKRLSRLDIIGYMNKNFVSGNMVISIAGNVKTAETARLVEDCFGGFTKGKPACFTPVKENQKKPDVSIYHKKTEQTQVYIGARTFSYEHPDFDVMHIINGILGLNMSSRLFTILREREGLVYSVSSGNDFYTDTGNFSVHAGAGHQNVMRTLKIILNEFGRLRDEKVTEEEMDRVKNCLTGYLYMVLDGSSGMANFTGRQELRTKKIISPAERIRKIKRITAGDVKRVAGDVFTGNRMNLALIGPFKDRRKFIELIKSHV